MRRCVQFQHIGVNYLARLLSPDLEKWLLRELVEFGERWPQRREGKGEGKRTGVERAEVKFIREPAVWVPRRPAGGRKSIVLLLVEPARGIRNVCSRDGHREVPEHL